MTLRVPLFGRLSFREYSSLILGFIFIAFEAILHFIILFLPTPVIMFFYNRSRAIYHKVVGVPKVKSTDRLTAESVLKAKDFEELCAIFGYEHEEHLVLTKDGYLLGIHRLSTRKGEKRERIGASTGKPVVYLHHGLLMNSEIWVCLSDEERCLPFVLVECGFDVWLGNNRGNKYSKKHIRVNPNSRTFWDYSIDEFAWHDIPDSIEYILETTKEESLGYVGFSQGTAQAFAALSIHPKLNERVNVFVAIAPAISPEGLQAPVIDALMKSSPTLLYLFFGRKSILSSATMWQSILYPPIFAKLIDISLGFLFDWHGVNISTSQKIAAYAHLYSYTSVKAVVHWFQIMRTSRFLMYDDELIGPVRLSGSDATYRPARFPTKNIVTPIVLLWGDSDSLVDIDAMLKQLPAGRTNKEGGESVVAKRLRGYEHLDCLWGKDVHVDVIPEVLDALKSHCEKREKLLVNGFKGPGKV
ncbi:hypothetical protein JAAARDRAFT_130275 [Jaapia argillacea MUCL 33604]|uniref:AB hydrolase-1 domain-containing protein n=1 Tax=Jaapia argillacea MUCL 33604 TaxID=933084 RepID=A0A067PRN8_9AGAM|nr:hypothetical protein JAAARDRAFT_130275 [Jaapia argillacea MUCL 33604]